MSTTPAYGTSTRPDARLARIRRRAVRAKEEIWKIREDSHHYANYGPYAVRSLVDHSLVAQNLTLDDLEKRYAR